MTTGRLLKSAALSDVERHQLLQEWNDTRSTYPRQACLGPLFEAQAARTPDAVALAFGTPDREDRQMSYRELDRRANRLARQLLALGVGPETRVGLCVEHPPLVLIGLVAILKAGGAYVPLDPASPRRRLALMLRDAAAEVLLHQDGLAEDLAVPGVRQVDLDADGTAIGEVPDGDFDRNPACTTTADSLAYVIFTSGSTGRPKGVGVPHRGVVRLVVGTNYLRLGPGDRVAMVTNIAFDAATLELWGALLHGARLVALPRDAVLVPRRLVAEMRRREITTILLTAALFNQVIAEEPTAFRTLRYMMVGGEPADPERVREALRRGPPRWLVNGYGPTESTTMASWYRVRRVLPQAGAVPI
ncbi:MAG: AMP-binding protein, partial [bacterium]|nr:AMP-binding protein [bacterium]